MGPSVKKFKEIVSQRNMVVLGVNNPHKKDSIANRWGKLFTAIQVKVGYLESRISDFANIVSRLLKGVMRSTTP